MELLPRAARAASGAALAAIIIVASLPNASGQTVDKQLERVKGTVGYQTGPGADFQPVFGRFTLPDNNLAVTRAQSAAVIVMPDSSLISIGDNTTVQVGAFNNAADGPGSTITINGGSLRFDIHRPTGGTSNYHFQTTTSQIAIRGTIGLISFVNNITTVGCLSCQAGSLTVTAGGQTATLLTGQFLTVSATGAITTGALTTALTTAFSGANVPISSVSTTAAAGVPAAGAGGLAGGAAGTAIGVGVGAAAAAAIGIAASNSASPQPSARPSAQPSSVPSSAPSSIPSTSPSASPTPSGGQSGNVNLTSKGTPAPARAQGTVQQAPTNTTAPPPVGAPHPLGPHGPRS